jgi:hypothetical protein
VASSDSLWAHANVVVPANSTAPVATDSLWATANATLDAPAANYGDGYWKGVSTLVVDPPSNGGSVLDGPWKTVNFDISTKHTPIGIKTAKGVVYCELLIKKGSTLV